MSGSVGVGTHRHAAAPDHVPVVVDSMSMGAAGGRDSGLSRPGSFRSSQHKPRRGSGSRPLTPQLVPPPQRGADGQPSPKAMGLAGGGAPGGLPGARLAGQAGPFGGLAAGAAVPQGQGAGMGGPGAGPGPGAGADGAGAGAGAGAASQLKFYSAAGGAGQAAAGGVRSRVIAGAGRGRRTVA